MDPKSEPKALLTGSKVEPDLTLRQMLEGLFVTYLGPNN